MEKLLWHGDIDKCLDRIEVNNINGVTAGCFGGATSSGQYKNEDGLYIITEENDFVLSIILDAHASNESTILVINELEKKEDQLKEKLVLPLKEAMVKVPDFFRSLIHDQSFITKSKSINGETAFLVVFQKENYLWWLSVGDNSLYLLHPEYAELGQYRLNERIFYQWIGLKNSIDLDIPCYTQSTIELRQGKNTIVMLTDGVLEYEGRPFDDSSKLYSLYDQYENDEATEIVLKAVQDSLGRDSATVISWNVNNLKDGLRPTFDKKTI